MIDTTRTAIYVGGAGLLVVLAALSTPGEVRLDFLEDTGTEFFPDFQDPADATNLEVIEFDEEKSAAKPFNVRRQDNGLWTIPSHANYPADAETRMAGAAALVVGLTKASVRSHLKADHKAFGVVDPLDQDLDLEGRGTRVTFRNASDIILADLILGKEVADHQGQHYVRLPNSNVTFTAEITPDLSTKFEDWIETDLLQVSSFDLTSVTFDNYSVDEVQRTLVEGERLDVKKVDGTWQLEGLAENEELNTENMTTAVTTLTNLEIVGVRAKPEGLTADLQRAQGFERQFLLQALQDKGYFLANGKLVSNEGDLLVRTQKGVVYTLRFGEIVYGSGDAVTSGNAPADAAAETQGGSPQALEASHRYLMITAHFDETLLDKPEGTPLPQEDLDQRQTARDAIQKIVDAVEAYRDANEALPETLTVLTEGDEPLLDELAKDPWDGDYVYETTEDGFVVRSFAADQAPGGEGPSADIASDAFDFEDALRDLVTDVAEYERKVTEGQEEAEKLSKRFGPWYYVIDAESFGKLHLQRTDLVKEKDGL